MIREAALEFDRAGINVFPAVYRDKNTLVEWKHHQTERVSQYLDEWFPINDDKRNIWVMTGPVSGLVVLDVDSDEAMEYWLDRIGGAMEVTTSVRTGSGKYHFWFRLPPDASPAVWRTWNQDTVGVADQGIRFDVRAAKSGVIAPPSIHETGGRYAWVRDLTHLQDAPDELRKPARRRGRATGSDIDNQTVRTLFSEMLANPPSEGGRNVWLSRIAGHLAKWVPHQDAYNVLVSTINGSLDQPLDDDEVAKTAESIWNTERDAQAEAAGQKAPTGPETGWLASGGDHLMCQCISDGEPYLDEWANFNLRCTSVVYHEDNRRSYNVEVVTDRRRWMDQIDGDTLGSTSLSPWLTARGLSIAAPKADIGLGTQGARLSRYLESQGAPVAHAVAYQGWDPVLGGYALGDQLIRADGPTPLVQHGAHIPARVLQRSPVHYGFGDLDDLRWVLSELVWFQEPDFVVPFMSWWAAVLAKPQLHERLSQFPVCILEAASGSGKSTGLVPLALQLAGSVDTSVDMTIPSLRDRLASHQSAIVFLDDQRADRVKDTLELIRQTTVRGSVAKKAANNHDTEQVKLVGAVLIAGEGLAQVHSEKALFDRSLLLRPRPPQKRMSRHDPTRRQWDDILAVQRRFPDGLSVLAGTMIQAAARPIEQLLANEGRWRVTPGGNNRVTDTVRALRFGSALLSEIIDLPDWWDDHLTGWSDTTVATGDLSVDMALNRILPWAIARDGVPRNPTHTSGVFVDPNGWLWVSPLVVSEQWLAQTRRLSDREVQLGQQNALVDQIRSAYPDTESRRYNLPDARNNHGSRLKRVYWCLPPDLAQLVLHKAQLELTDVNQGGETLLPRPPSVSPGRD